MRRVYYPYDECEEFAAGLWRMVAGIQREKLMQAASEFMADLDGFKGAMFQAVCEWPRSAAANLSAEATNRRAWLGQAACFLGTGAPEEVTRTAWHLLTEEQQVAANLAADAAIAAWERGLGASAEAIVQLWLLENTDA